MCWGNQRKGNHQIQGGVKVLVFLYQVRLIEWCRQCREQLGLEIGEGKLTVKEKRGENTWVKLYIRCAL